MKKVLYFALLAIELFVGSMLMISLWDSCLYIPIAVSVTSVLGLLIWQVIRYFMVTDPRLKRKILLNIAVVMLIPMAVFFVTYVVVAIMFIIAFI